MGLRVLDPRFDDESEPARMAPPLATLEGALVGLLDNGKIGVSRFYDHVEEILRGRFAVREVLRRRKPDMSRPVPPDLLAELGAADAILSGIGD
jgi:hypothetical protein